MSRVAVAAVALLAALPAIPQVVDDGLYVVSEDGTGTSVPTAEGRLVTLGERQAFSAKAALLRSLDNQNTSFDLTLRDVGPPLIIPAGGIRELLEDPGPSTTYALVLAGRAYTGGGRPDAIFRFDAEAALDVARRLDVPIHYHRHPGHRLQASFTPLRESFELGEPVIVTFRLRNIGPDALAMLDRGRAPEPAKPDARYVFAVYRWGSETVPDRRGPLRDAGAVAVRLFEPDQMHSEVLNLSDAFAFDEPGLYRIFGTFSLAFYEPGSKSVSTPIWNDYVTRSFSVTITPRAGSN